jgi:phage baseplate assembly protein W
MTTGAFNPATELRGLALPALRGTQGFFASKNAFDVAWGDLLLALFTPRGSRPMDRAFGSNLYELLFDPIDVEDEIIDVSIREIARQFCPHIAIRSVVLTNVSSGKIQVGVVFSLASDQETVERRSVLIPKIFVSVPGVA